MTVPTETRLAEGAFFGEDLEATQLPRPPEALPELLPELPVLRESGAGGTNEGEEGLAFSLGKSPLVASLDLGATGLRDSGLCRAAEAMPTET